MTALPTPATGLLLHIGLATGLLHMGLGTGLLLRTGPNLFPQSLFHPF